MYERDEELKDVPEEINRIHIPLSQLNYILDKHINGDQVFPEEEEIVVWYCMQDFYRNNKQYNIKSLHEKYNLLIGSRLIEIMQEKGYIKEQYYNPETNEIEFEFDEEKLNDILQKG